MEPISLTEFAEREGVSYAAIRLQVRRYEDELKGHIVKKPHKNGVFLDEWAQTFLSERRGKSKAAVFYKNQGEEYERLKTEVADLKQKLAEAAETIAVLKGDKAEAEERLTELQNQVLAAQEEARSKYEKIGEEAQDFEPFLFSLYRKKPGRKERT